MKRYCKSMDSQVGAHGWALSVNVQDRETSSNKLTIIMAINTKKVEYP